MGHLQIAVELLTKNLSQTVTCRTKIELSTNKYLAGIPTEVPNLIWDGPVMEMVGPEKIAFQCISRCTAAAMWSQEELRFRHYLECGRTREANLLPQTGAVKRHRGSNKDGDIGKATVKPELK